MTDEQRQRIHAITYSTDDRAELAERIVRLEEENARLREYATKLEQTNDQLSNDNCELLCDMQNIQQFFIDNNTKLRKLVRDMWDAALHPETFGDGSHLLMRMRDLGIEVEA